MKYINMLTQEQLKDYLHYEPNTGVFTRLKTTKTGGHKAGEVIGKSIDNHGYHITMIHGKSYRLHRLAFLYMEGTLPEYVDHKNTNQLDNRWCNLRKSTSTQNNHNRKFVKGASGVKGVQFSDHKTPGYITSIMCNGKRHLNWFPLSKYASKEEAFKAACSFIKDLRQQLHGDFTNHG